MRSSSEILNMAIQAKFKKALDAKKEGKLYDFKKELRDDLESRENEIKHISRHEWKKIKKVLKEIK